MINHTAECLVKLSYDGLHCIQKICLGDYNKVISRLPKHSKVRLLCYLGDCYKWLEVKDFIVSNKRSLYDVYRSEETGFEVVCNKDKTFNIAVIPRNVFDMPRIDFSSYVLGLSILDKYNKYRVKWEQDGKEKSWNLKTYLSNKKRALRYLPKLYSPNDVKLDIEYISSDINTLVDALICSGGELWPSESYLINVLASSWALCPPMLNEYFEINWPVKDVQVPYNIHALMYLRQGYLNNFNSKILRGRKIVNFNIKELEFKKLSSQRNFINLNIKLEDDRYNILLLSEGFPIRWQSV